MSPNNKTKPDVEQRVLRLIRQKYTRKLIAQICCISASTVGRIAKSGGTVVVPGTVGRPKGKVKIVKMTLAGSEHQRMLRGVSIGLSNWG